MNSPVKPWNCSFCDKCFTAKRGLQVHIETIHENSKQYPCTECERVFKQKGNLRNHVKVFHQKTKDFKCDVCEHEFSAIALLDKHMSSVHKVSLHYDCDICSLQFNARKLLRHHKRVIHREESQKKMSVPKKTFVCSKCLGTFSDIIFLSSHLLTCDFPEMSSSKMTITSPLLNTSLELHQQYICSECKMNFKDKKDLNAHQMSHKETCKICGRDFENKIELLAHLGHEHGPKEHCEDCDLSFKSSELYKSHIQRVHSKNEEKEKFDICLEQLLDQLEKHRDRLIKLRDSKYFRQNSLVSYPSIPSLSTPRKKRKKKRRLSSEWTHRRLDEKKYECSYCSKTFTQRGTLNRHVKTLHGESQEQQLQPQQQQQVQQVQVQQLQFSCEHCQREFNLKSDYETHMSFCVI